MVYHLKKGVQFPTQSFQSLKRRHCVGILIVWIILTLLYGLILLRMLQIIFCRKRVRIKSLEKTGLLVSLSAMDTINDSRRNLMRIVKLQKILNAYVNISRNSIRLFRNTAFLWTIYGIWIKLDSE